MSRVISTTLEKICLQEKGALISGPFGSNISSKYFVETGIPVIRGNNLSIKNEYFTDSGFVFVTKEKADELNCYALKDDLIFTAAGTIGQVGIIPQKTNYEIYVISNKQIRARLNTQLIDTLFAYYWFSSPWMRKKLIESNKGTTVPLLTLSEVRDLPISYPSDISAQKNISYILSSIDQKIQNNNKIIKELEDMARAIFNHHFILEEPNDNIDNIIIEHSKSQIKVNDAKDVVGEYPFFTSGSKILRWNESLIDGRNCFLNTGGNADIKFYTGKSAYSTDTWCITAKYDLQDYLYLFLKSIQKEIGEKFFQGTGLKHLQKDLLREKPIYKPTEIEIREFNILVRPIFDKVHLNTLENQQLTALRDWLLPMLMNGQAMVE